MMLTDISVPVIFLVFFFIKHQNIGKKMTLNAFMTNLEGMNEGTNFPRAALKALYNAIKLHPLEWIADDDDDEDGSDEGISVRKGSKKLAKNGTMGNPLVTVSTWFTSILYYTDMGCHEMIAVLPF